MGKLAHRQLMHLGGHFRAGAKTKSPTAETLVESGAPSRQVSINPTVVPASSAITQTKCGVGTGASAAGHRRECLGLAGRSGLRLRGRPLRPVALGHPRPRTAESLDHIRELLRAHWREAEDAADDDGKFGIAFKATFDRGAQPTKIKVTCSIAKTISDEIESEIEDPRQQKLL